MNTKPMKTKPHGNIKKSSHHLHYENNQIHHHTTYQTIKRECRVQKERKSKIKRKTTHHHRLKSNPLIRSPNKLPHFDSVSKFVAFNVIYEPRKESLNVGEHDSTRTEQSHNQAWESNSDTKLENSLVVEVKGESALNGYPLKQNQGRVPKP